MRDITSKKVGLQRMAIKDGKLQDGTVIPSGYFVAVDISTVHKDPAVYSQSNEFDPFRFSRVREEDMNDAKQVFATANKDVSSRHVLSSFL
jgi:cytochrome P450